MFSILDRPTRRRAPLLGLALIVAAGSGWAGEAHPQPAKADVTAPADAAKTDITVKKVVLFSSGVGYFEHSGKITGNATSELRFKSAQINDVLKSLVVEDAGGQISGIAYPSFDPIAKTLKSFQVDIAGNPTLGDLLNQLRGAVVTVTVGTEHTTGTILGLEKHKRQGTPEQHETTEEWRLNLISGATLRSIDLDQARSIELQDPVLQGELAKALAALSQARDQDKKPVVISFTGAGERDVRVGYVVETPVWKTSYRLILSSDAKVKPTLQGWAIVENQTDNDWNDVALTLVSGRPISFIQDLYQPLYVPRPTVQPELYASLRPQTYDDGIADGKMLAQAGDKAKAAMAMPAPPAMARRMAGFNRPEAAAASADAAREMDATAGVASVATAEKVGEFFKYTVENVSLPRQRSSMLPIVAEPIEVQRVSIYNQSVLAKNPLLGARLVNSTANHLLQGPITVLDAGSYGGDARIDDVPPGQERLISFAIDLQVRVEAQNRRQDTSLVAAKISQGTLHLQHKLVTTQEYLVDNKSDHDRDLIIEHPIQAGWKLVDSPKPIETTDHLYRFQQAIAAGKTDKIVVKEEFIQHEAMAVVDFDTPTLESYAATGEIGKDVRAAMTKAAQMRRAIDDTSRQIDEHQRKVSEITAEQERIRQNMKTVQQNNEYYNRLLAKLNAQESQLETLRDENDKLVKDREQKLQELRAYLAGLDLG